LVEGILLKYVWMPPHEATILALWICFTHVYQRFRIAPRGALTSEGPDSGKSTALEVARRLVFRPNPEALGTAAAIVDFLDVPAPYCSMSLIKSMRRLGGDCSRFGIWVISAEQKSH
jgi:hypothetical protein